MKELKKKIRIPITDTMTREEKRTARAINRRLAQMEEDEEAYPAEDNQNSCRQ